MATRLIPFQEGMKLGFGYDLVSGTPLTTPAAQGTISSIQGAGGQLVESHLVRITDLDTLHQSLGVNVDSGGSYFGASADVKVNYAKECSVSKFGSVQESVRDPDFSGVWPCRCQAARRRRHCGNVGTRV